jgi:isopenicillin-N N-acyltransferase like protein
MTGSEQIPSRNPVQRRRLPVVVDVAGAPYERGFQHGRQCGDLIARYPDLLAEILEDEGPLRGLVAAGAKPSRERLFAEARAFLPGLTAFAPHLVEEVRGIADGAQRPFDEVLLVNVRGEVLGLIASPARTAGAGDACTAFAVGPGSRGSSVLAGQNLDQDPRNGDLLIVLRVEPDEGPAMLMCSFAGLVGYPGLNAAGVAVFQNALSTSVWRGDGMPHYFMKRVLLKQQSVADCVAVMRRSRVCSSGNYVLADRHGLLDVELTPDGLATVEASDGVLVHANHFLDPDLTLDDVLLPRLPDSASRVARLRELVANEQPRTGLHSLQAAMSDHAGYPTSICRHEERMVTIASMIAEPERGYLHVAAGNPCAWAYETYALEA